MKIQLQKYECEYPPRNGGNRCPELEEKEMLPYQACEWVKVDDLQRIMDELIEEIPAGFDYAESGRYQWPKRWKMLRAAIEGSGDPVDSDSL